MAHIDDWKFELARSSDLVPIGELANARDRSLTLTLNKAGSFSFTLPMDDELAMELNEVSSAVLIKRKQLDGTFKTVWSGLVWGIEETTPNTVAVSTVGWLQTLEKRFISEDQTFTSTDAGSIATTILDLSNQGIIGPIYVIPGNIQATINRDRTYKAYETVLSIIQGLSDIENGFDFEVDPSSRELNIYNILMTDLPNIVFEYGANVKQVQRISDASKIVNRFTAFGSSTAIAQQANDEDSQIQYGLFEESQSLSDVNDSNILAAYAAAEVITRSQPLRIYSLIPYPASEVHKGIYRIFTDFNIGDKVYLTINKGRLIANRQPIRIFSVTISFTNDGAEHITNIQTTAS